MLKAEDLKCGWCNKKDVRLSITYVKPEPPWNGPGWQVILVYCSSCTAVLGAASPPPSPSRS